MLRCVPRLLLPGDALGGALVALGALFFRGGGKPSQADDIPVETSNVAGKVDRRVTRPRAGSDPGGDGFEAYGEVINVASDGINNRTGAYQIPGVATGICQTRGHATARCAGCAYPAGHDITVRTGATPTANFSFTTRFGVATGSGTPGDATRLGGAVARPERCPTKAAQAQSGFAEAGAGGISR